MARSWDIFCSVVDNYGDVGVCWRLARQLAAEHRQQVRLWVDDLARLHQLCRAADAAADTQNVLGVEVRRWERAEGAGVAPFPRVEVADIVIEAFGVRLPESYLVAMAERAPSPVWVNLEYLSAEPWVDTHHGLPSPQPALPLTKYFFFPGFTESTGGLLIERGLAARREAFQADAAAMAGFRKRIGLREPANAGSARRVSLFCYDNAALPSLLDAWSASAEPVVCVVAEGRATAQVADVIGLELAAGVSFAQGSLTLLPIPFLEQDDYDRLLWMCDVNFVRGEDSLVRAQLAARPLVWQAYPQADDAHLAKTRAFLDLYAAGLAPAAGDALRAMFEAWNRQDRDTGARWNAFAGELAGLGGHARDWAARLVQGKSLADTLAQFCENRL